jgi:hypothetical protein
MIVIYKRFKQVKLGKPWKYMATHVKYFNKNHRGKQERIKQGYYLHTEEHGWAWVDVSRVITTCDKDNKTCKSEECAYRFKCLTIKFDEAW